MVFLTSFQCFGKEPLIYWGIGHKRNPYITELLTLVLNHAKPNSYQVSPLTPEIPHFRAFQALEANDTIDIVIGYATEERLSKYRAIELPIMKGLNGWRVSIVKDNNVDLLKGVETTEQLSAFKPGLFHTWTDNKILLANKLTTVTGTDYEGLFKMLSKERFDYLPLTILDVENEYVARKDYPDLDIAIDPHVLIVYPVCFYFYVNKTNTELATLIEDGFEAIIINGQFEALFHRYFNSSIEKVAGPTRTIIQLENPLLPESVPLNRDDLWMHQLLN